MTEKTEGKEAASEYSRALRGRIVAVGPDGYPTDAALEALLEWPITDMPAAVEYAAETFNAMLGRAWKVERGEPENESGQAEWHFATGGWSGCEDVIGALQDSNHGVLWMGFWVSSRRGGKFVLTAEWPRVDAHHPGPAGEGGEG